MPLLGYSASPGSHARMVSLAAQSPPLRSVMPQNTVNATSVHGAPRPPQPRRFMSGQFHTAQFRSGCVATIFRSSGGGTARKRRRRPGPRQYHPAASRRRRTSDSPTRSSPAQLHGRMHTGPVSHHGAEQESTPEGGSTTPPRQRSREAAWWDVPGPALPRGPSADGLKTDSTVSLYGRSWPRGEAVRHTLTKRSPHEPRRGRGRGGSRPPVTTRNRERPGASSGPQSGMKAWPQTLATRNAAS